LEGDNMTLRKKPIFTLWIKELETKMIDDNSLDTLSDNIELLNDLKKGLDYNIYPINELEILSCKYKIDTRKYEDTLDRIISLQEGFWNSFKVISIVLGVIALTLLVMMILFNSSILVGR
jgi:hypothetical protein